MRLLEQTSLIEHPPRSGGDAQNEKTPKSLDEANDRIAALEQENADLREQIRRDAALPDLLNKASWHADLDNRISEGNAFGIFVCDLNNFKRLNDTLGHEAGDTLLREFSVVLKVGFKRESDELAFLESTDNDPIIRSRIGGDEFAITINLAENMRRGENINSRMDEAYTYLEKIWSDFIVTRPELVKLGLGLSIGPAIWDPTHPLTAAELYSQADEAMYEYKEDAAERQSRVLGTTALVR